MTPTTSSRLRRFSPSVRPRRPKLKQQSKHDANIKPADPASEDYHHLPKQIPRSSTSIDGDEEFRFSQLAPHGGIIAHFPNNSPTPRSSAPRGRNCSAPAVRGGTTANGLGRLSSHIPDHFMPYPSPSPSVPSPHPSLYPPAFPPTAGIQPESRSPSPSLEAAGYVTASSSPLLPTALVVTPSSSSEGTQDDSSCYPSPATPDYGTPLSNSGPVPFHDTPSPDDRGRCPSIPPFATRTSSPDTTGSAYAESFVRCVENRLQPSPTRGVHKRPRSPESYSRSPRRSPSSPVPSHSDPVTPHSSSHNLSPVHPSHGSLNSSPFDPRRTHVSSYSQTRSAFASTSTNSSDPGGYSHGFRQSPSSPLSSSSSSRSSSPSPSPPLPADLVLRSSQASTIQSSHNTHEVNFMNHSFFQWTKTLDCDSSYRGLNICLMKILSRV